MTSFRFCVPFSLAAAIRQQILQRWGKLQLQQGTWDLDFCLCLYCFFPLWHRKAEWESSLSCCTADLYFSILPCTVLPPRNPHKCNNYRIWSNENIWKIRDMPGVCNLLHLQFAFQCPVLRNVKALHVASVARCINKMWVYNQHHLLCNLFYNGLALPWPLPFFVFCVAIKEDIESNNGSILCIVCGVIEINIALSWWDISMYSENSSCSHL